MTVSYDKDETGTLDRTTGPTLTAPATVAAQGVCIEVKELSRRVRVRNREEVTLLDAVSLSLPAGELVAIVGPSGAGKTTLLEAIAGIAPATSGSVCFDGIDLYANPETFATCSATCPRTTSSMPI